MSRKTNKRARTDAHRARKADAKFARALSSGWTPTEAEALAFKDAFTRSLWPQGTTLLDPVIDAALQRWRDSEAAASEVPQC